MFNNYDGEYCENHFSDYEEAMDAVEELASLDSSFFGDDDGDVDLEDLLWSYIYNLRDNLPLLNDEQKKFLKECLAPILSE